MAAGAINGRLMTVNVDVWLRGSDFATTESIEGVAGVPGAWTDDDVRVVLEGMLRAMDRRKNPSEPDRPIALRGLSWIVNPFEDGGVVIAIEITLGAAVAGPFDIEQKALETMISRVLAHPAVPASSRVH
jgi:hypothetical protein